jgi:hypothetical protein
MLPLSSPASTSPTCRWCQRHWHGKLAFLVLVLGAGLAFGLPKILLRLDPRLVVQLYSDHGKDPWGRKLITSSWAESYCYSVGPNGVDETHLFVDVRDVADGRLSEAEWDKRVLGRWTQGPNGDDVPFEPTPLEQRLRGVLGFTPVVVGTLVLSAWLFACPWAPRNERRGVEVRRVILLASVPACLLYLAGSVALEVHPITWIGVPPELALALSCALGSLIVATAVRLKAAPTTRQ